MTDSRPSISDFLQHNALLAILLGAHLPFLCVYFAGLWKLEHYQFFPFALAAFAGLYLSRADRAQIQLSRLGRAAIVLDILLLCLSTIAYWPKMAVVGFCFLCFAVCSGSQEWQYQRRLTSVSLIPAILVTPPRGMDLYAIFWLQQQTTWLASRLLEKMGYLHLRRGNIIELPEKQLLVEQACSGVQSLFTVIFLALLIICWQRRGLIHGVLLLLSGILYAGTMNVFRVVVIAIAWQEFQLDLTAGWLHDGLGYLALIIAILLLISSDSLLRFLLAPFRDHLYGPFAGLYSNPFTMLWNFAVGGRLEPREDVDPAPRKSPGRRVLQVSGLAAGLALVLQCVLLAAGGYRATTLQQSDTSFFPEHVLLEQTDGFNVFGYRTESRSAQSKWGAFSNIWQLRGHGMTVLVSVDHPFRDWHYLNLCYTGTGWNVLPPSILKDDADWPSSSFSMKDDQNGRYGHVLYSHFTADGRQLQPSNPGLSLRYLLERFRRHTSRGPWAMVFSPSSRTSYQIQLLAESAQPISDEQLTALRKLHLTTRRRIHQHFCETQPTVRPSGETEH